MNETSDTTRLKIDIWHDAEKKKREPEWDYDPELDILCVYFVPIAENEKVLTHHADRNVGLLVRHSDHEVIGLRIESYKESFLPVYGQKEWSLVNTGTYLRGIRELTCAVHEGSTHRKEGLSNLPRPLRQTIQIKPIFA